MRIAKAMWQLLRLDHDIMLAVGVIIGYAISGGFSVSGSPAPMFSALTAFLIGAGAFALNDYLDVEVDRRNKRMDRPLVRGDLSPKIALASFFIVVPLGLLCSIAVSIHCFLVALFTAFFAVIYDVWVKKLKLLGNFYIAYMMAIPFVFGGLAASSIPVGVFVLAAMAYLSGFGREVMKDILDLPGDAKSGIRSFPSVFGEKRSRMLSSATFVGAVALSPVPFILGSSPYFMDPFYLAPVLVADLIFVFVVFSLVMGKGEDLRRYRGMTLIAMVIGLVGFLLGAFLP